MVALSVPQILDHYGGRCRTPEAESCINGTQEALFFTGMVLIALGRAGISFSLDALQDEQSNAEANCLQKAIENYLECAVWSDKLVIYVIGSLLIFIWIRKWKLLFGIPAIYSAYMGIWFLCGCCFYIQPKPKRIDGSPLTSICRVLYAAATSKKKSQSFNQRDDDPKPFFDRFPR